MLNIYSVEKVRKADKAACEKESAIKLIWKAATGLFNAYDYHGRIAIIVGVGNNGADGLALSLIMHQHGLKPDVYLLSEKVSPDSSYYLEEVRKVGIDVKLIDEKSTFNYDIIVDCIFGIGYSRKPDEVVASLFRRINESGAFVISADINSGLNATNGIALGVRSNLTVAIDCYKYGHFLNDAKDVIGSLKYVDIGFELAKPDAMLIEECDLKKLFPKRRNNTNKGDYGYVGIIGGSKLYPGAASLAALGQDALYSGAGVAKLIVPDVIADSLYANILETTVVPMNSDNGYFKFNQEELEKVVRGLSVVAIGIGIGQHQEIELMLEWLLKCYNGILIIDADGLNNLSNMELSLLKEANAKVVLTPHPKEFSRLSGMSVGEILENPVETAKDFAKKYGVILLLKGCTTVITDGEKVYLSNSGDAGMAKAGSGDVLTGILTGILGMKRDDILLTVAEGAYLNGLAGEKAAKQFGQISMVASDTARALRTIIRDGLER